MRCPKCGTEVAEGRKFCGACGTPLASQAQSATGATLRGGAPAENFDTSPCPMCGAALTRGRAFCGRCGASVGSRPENVGGAVAAAPVPRYRQAQPRPPINWRKLIVSIGVPLLLACAGVGAWYFLPRYPLPPEKTGTILDRASSGQILTFNHEGPGRKRVLLMSGEDIWEIPTGASYYSGRTGGVHLSADGQHVLSYGTIFNLDTKHSEALHSPEPQWIRIPTGSMPNEFRNSVFSNGGTLVAAARNNGSLHIFDVSTAQPLHTLRSGVSSVPAGGKPCYITSLSFSPNDGTLASGELNGYISLWRTSTGDLVGTLPSQDNEPCDDSAAQVPNYSSRVQALAFSPRGDSLASKDGFGIIRVWNVGSRKVLYTLPFHFPAGEGWSKVEFSPDGQLLVTSGNALKGEMVLVWDAANGHLLRGITVPGMATFDFLPSGDLVLAQLVGNRVKVERWAARSRFRIPFVSHGTSKPGETDSTLLEAYEEETLNHLAVLQSSLGSYMGGIGKGSFPHGLEDLGQDSARDRQQFRKDNCGYQYIYTPGSANAEGSIATYAISARPLLYGQSGTRSFEVDQSGQVHATGEAREATASDPVFSSLPDAVQIATNGQTGVTTGSTGQGAGAAEAAPAAGGAPQPAFPQSTAEAEQLVSRAENQFQQADYRGAIQSCDAALRIEPGNARAARLKAKVEETMRILGKN